MELILIGFVLLALLAAVVVFAACALSARAECRAVPVVAPEPLRDGAPGFVRRLA
jgi:hypothetical protein